MFNCYPSPRLSLKKKKEGERNGKLVFMIFHTGAKLLSVAMAAN